MEFSRQLEAGATSNTSDLFDNTMLARLLDVGFMSVNLGLLQEAEQVLGGIWSLDPQRIEAALGLALLRWRRDGNQSAIDWLREVEKSHPNSEPAQAFLALILADAQRLDEALDVARKLINAGDPDARQFARSLLRELASMSTV